jgi:hypothetical protein
MKLIWFNAVLVKLISCQKVSRQFMIRRIMICQSQKYLLANIVQKFPLPSMIFCTITKCITKCFHYLSFIVVHANFIHKNLPSQKNMWKESIELMNTNHTFVNIAMGVGTISIIFSDMWELITRRMLFATYAEKNWNLEVYNAILQGNLLRGIDHKTIRRLRRELHVHTVRSLLSNTQFIKEAKWSEIAVFLNMIFSKMETYCGQHCL